MTSKPGVAAVDRAFAILEAFKTEGPTLTLAEISRTTGLYKSTILRIMGSLEKFDYVRQLPDGNYQLGPKLAELSAIYLRSFNLRDYVQPVLVDIVDRTKEGASFFIRDGEQQICLYREDGRQAIRDHHIHVGDRWDLNAGASAKVIRKFGNTLATNLTLDQLAQTSVGEKQPEMAAVSVPVFGRNDEFLGSLSISGPLSRFTPDYIEKMSAICIASGLRLSMSIGASREHLSALLKQVEAS